jgi:hypothetical protein
LPYRHAWAFIALLIAATIFVFWHRYFTILATSPVSWHLHGITAGVWMLLLLAQSRTPHSGQMALHRLVGKASFVAVPLFAAGSLAVIHSMAATTNAGDPFYALWGAKLAFVDLVAFAAVLYGAGMALRHRREVRLHAGYMLSTALPLVAPVLGRVITDTVPGLTIGGPQDFPVFGLDQQLANLAAALIALWLWRRDPRFGQPWAAALVVITIQIIGFELVPATTGLFGPIGTLPLPAFLLAGLAAGVAAVLAGWRWPAPRARAVSTPGQSG